MLNVESEQQFTLISIIIRFVLSQVAMLVENFLSIFLLLVVGGSVIVDGTT